MTSFELIEARFIRKVYVVESIFPVVVRPAHWWERMVHGFRLWRQGQQERKAAVVAEKVIKRLVEKRHG